MELKQFNLELLQDFFKPIDRLEGKINLLKSKYDHFTKLSEELVKTMDRQDLSLELKKINKQIQFINKKLLEINQKNLEGFLGFQDNLITKYKQIHIKRLMELAITLKDVKKIGLSLIEEKKTSKIIKKGSYLPSIRIQQWTDLLDSLKKNSLFTSIIEDIKKYYEEIIDEKLKRELSKIPKDFETSIVEEFKKLFHKNPDLTFDRFIRKIQRERIQKELEEKSEAIQEAKKKDKIQDLKRKQEEQKKLFNDYLKYSDKEFERRRRKKKREKLSDIAQKPKKQESISEDVEEKIKKFKSKFENSFEDRYLIQKDETDPRNIVRDRKKKKEEEYKEFLKKFENNSKKED